jgi:glycosyltransferase involved in cell wall biosynthesis
LVEPDNPKAFVEGILELADNERLSESLGEQGKIIVTGYIWKKSAKKQ